MADNEKTPRPLFGQIAVMAEFCTQDQVNECLKIQNKGKKAGTHFYIGSIMLNKGYITLPQALQILKYQKVQIVQDPSNNNRYNVHEYSNNKKYRSPESKELLASPPNILTITVRGDMGLKKVAQEAAEGSSVPGTLHDIDSTTYDMSADGSAIDVTSLNLEVDSPVESAQPVAFDDIGSQTEDAEMIDPFGGSDFSDDLFGQSAEEFQDAEPFFAEEEDAFGTIEDDPFASSVDMFNDAEAEAEKEKTSMQDKFPKQMNSSFYVGADGSGTHEVEARQGDDEWGEWEDSGESDEPKADEQQIDRTLDGPVMAKLSSEERALSDDFDLVDGATMMDSDAGVAMGAELRDLMKRENLDFSEQGATTFEDAVAAFDTEASDDESLEADEEDFADDPFAQVSGGEFGSTFDEDLTGDFFDTQVDEGDAETIQDEPFDSMINEDWDVPDISEDEEKSKDFEEEISEEISGAQFWDTVPEGEESEIEQPGVTDDVFAQQLPGDTDDTGQDAAVGAGITDFDQFEKFADSISEDASSDEEGMQTVEMFTSEGELDEAARDELMLDSIDSMQSNIDAEVEFSSEMMEEAEGALGGDIAQAEGALGGDIAQAEGELEGDVLELESESASAYLVSESPRAVDPIARQIKKKRKRDIDYVEEFALDEITKLDQEKDEYVVREEKTDVDIQYVREEKTDLDIKRPSGWRSLFYGRRATDAKAKVNWVFFIFFLIGLSIIACGVAMLTDFIYTNGEMFDQISAYFSKNFELDNADMPDEVWNDYVFARDLTRNYEFQRALESFNHSVRQYPAYKTLFQSERTAMIKLQNEVDDLIGIEYNAAIERTRDEKGLRAALSNTEKFIEKYSQKPYSNLSKSADYIKNAQDEIVRIKSELEEELIPKEPELIDRLKKVCAWAPVELLDNTEEFETEFQKYNAILKEMSSKIMPFWKNKDVELFKRVYVRYIAVSRFFEKEVILCELLMKESETSDFDIKSIWHAISEVKSAEEAVRKYNEFDSVLETDWILENKHRINNEYVDKVYGSLQMAYDQAKGLTTAEYKTKIDLLKKLLEDIELAKELELKEEIREAINEMESDINSMLTDLIRYSNYTDWRNEALTNLKNGDIDVALEYFNKIYPFTEDVNKDEIKAAYNKCQFLVLKRDAPAAFNKALMYNANLTKYTKEELMQIWEKSYDLYTKLYGLLFDAEGNLFDYVYDDNKQDGFEVVNDCVEYKLISESLKHLWTAQYQFEIGMNDRNYEIFKTAKGNYNKALPYFMSHYDWYQKQANEIKILIAKCDFEPLKLESIAVREQAVELMELKNREKAEEALRLTEYSDELWNDALVIEQNNDLRAIHAKDVQELVKIANLIDEIKRAIRRHLYEEKLDEAVIYEQNEDFNRAITVLENAKIYTTDLRWLKKYINILTVKDLMKKAKALAIKEPAEYDEALKLLNEAAKIDPLESEIYVLKNRYTYLQKKSELKKKNAAEMSLIASGTALLHDGKQVEFKDYYIDKNEVTNAEYAKFLKFLESIDNNDDLFRHPKQPTDVTGITGLGVRSHVPKCWGFPGYNDPNQPVVGVTYWDAYAYAKWAGKRLPYVSEWEYAAAGNARRVYPWSSEALIDNAFCAELAKKMQKTYPMLANSLIAGAVVGTEIMHMIGNVREWTALDAEGSETAVVKGGSFKTPLSQTTNGSEEILKLGSWDDATGFRCVMDK